MTEPWAIIIAAEEGVPDASAKQKGCASFGWLHLFVGAIVLLRGVDSGEEGTGFLQGALFDDIANTKTAECDAGWIESLEVDHGHWVDGIRVYCSDDPTTIKFVVGKENDVSEKEVCEGSGGITNITGYSYNWYVSNMTFICLDGTEFGTYGSKTDDDSVIMSTSCDSSYQYATGFKYYQGGNDIITDCDAVSCSGGGNFEYLQLMCSNISSFSESDNLTESDSQVDESPIATDSDDDSLLIDAAWEIAVTVIGAAITATAAMVGGVLWRRRCTQAGQVQESSLPMSNRPEIRLAESVFSHDNAKIPSEAKAE